jgi:hypothetical protein
MHHMHMYKKLELIINGSVFICIQRKKTCPKHSNLSSFQNLFIHAVYHLPTKLIKQMVYGIVKNI